MSRLRTTLLICGLMTTLAAAEPVVRVTMSQNEANAVIPVTRIPAEGLRLWLKPVGEDAAATLSMRLHHAKPEFGVEPAGGLGSDFAKAVVLVPRKGQSVVARHTVIVKRRARGWFVYVDDVLEATFPQRFPGRVEILHDEELAPEVDEDDEDDDNEAYIQLVASFNFTDDFLIDKEDVEGAKLNQWDKLAGRWTIHSVLTDSEENPAGMRRVQNLNQQQRRNLQKLSAEHSPNFYCVEGSGNSAMMLAGYEFQERYSLSAAVHSGLEESGLAFLVRPSGAMHAFTALPRPDGEGLRFTFWRSSDGKLAGREILAQYDTDLFAGQWHKLEVRLFDERVSLHVDGIQLGSIATALPPGGRYGLFANGSESTRFDDVVVASHEDLEFADPGEFSRSLIYRSGTLDSRRGKLPVALAEDENASAPARHLTLAPSGQTPGVVVFGTMQDAPHVVATALQGGSRPFEVALLTGWQGPDSATLRFIVRQTANERSYRLEWFTPASGEVSGLAQLDLSLPPSAEPLQLMLDATPADGVRAYVDGRMVLVAPEVVQPRGASGLAVYSQRAPGMALPLYRTERRVYWNKVEKTAAFAEDPFMREWATPEGEWVVYPDQKAWFKGDIFGALAVKLPWKENVTLYPAVPEESEAGLYRIVADGEGLHLKAESDAEAAEEETIASVPLDELAWEPVAADASNRFYTVHLEDHALWVSSGGRALFLQPLPELLTGRRLRVAGMTYDDLARTTVDRSGIADFLFTESLYEWRLNGGSWEVVNRFQCDPRWSHLNGQNAESRAALWSRYEFVGDFCAELYAGMRHGWYNRAGDLNLTVLGSEESPSSGYTFVCTGWDVDESQLYSRLLRDGEVLATSDMYLAPRFREGNVRRGYVPLLRDGRDIHGAWYYTRLRRAGKKLQVIFDNEPVLTVEDPAPLEAGGLGIWTYLNSMVVARVRMSAEHIRPKRFEIRPVEIGQEPESAVANGGLPAASRRWLEGLARSVGLDSVSELAASETNPHYPARPKALPQIKTADDLLLTNWTPDDWVAVDDVSLARLDWLPTAGYPDIFVMTARQSAGTFLASNTVDAVPLRHLAGWRFETARSPGALYNFHYTVGRMTDRGFVPAQRFVHVLSGNNLTRGPVLRTGQTNVEPAEEGADPATEGPWTEVQVWLPAFPQEESSLMVVVDGFGNIEASDVQQGLLGNRPGDSYAVRGFAPILMETPVLAEEGLAAELRVEFSEAVGAPAGDAPYSRALPGLPEAFAANAYWVQKPTNLELTAAWSDEWHDAIEIRSAIKWPMRHFKTLAVRVNQTPAKVVPREGNRLLVLIPETLRKPEDGIYHVELATSERRPAAWGLPTIGRADAPPPILRGLRSPVLRLINFEDEPVGKVVRYSTVHGLDPQQGRHTRTLNSGQSRRLATDLIGGVDLIANPLLQFRQRGAGMAFVSVRSGAHGDVEFTETAGRVVKRKVRGHNPGIEEDWQTWLGILTDNIAERYFDNRNLFASQGLNLSSTGNPDQTGRYAELWVDDIVSGPAVGPQRPLRLTPQLLDLVGDGYLEWAVLPGMAPWHSVTNAPADGDWQRSENNVELDVPFDGLADGIHHLLLRPASPRGAGGVVDIPFMLDSQPPKATFHLENAPDFGNGTRLRLVFDTFGGSQPQFDKLKLTCNDVDYDLISGGTRIMVQPEAAAININWPRLFEDQIMAASDGDDLMLRVEGLVDGAGNIGEEAEFVLPIRHADDKTPPTIQSTSLPSNIAWMSSWHEAIFSATFRNVNQAGHQLIPARGDTPAHVQISVNGSKAHTHAQFGRDRWNLDQHPWLTFRAGFATLPRRKRPEALTLTLFYLRGRGGEQQSISVPIFDDADKLPDEFIATTDWSEGGISEFMVDVRSLMRRLVPGRRVSRIVGLRFEFESARHSVFNIYQAAVMAPWGEDHIFGVKAYDASGVAGFVWPEDGASNGTRLRPARLDLPADLNWLRLQVRDRPGNKSFVIHLPLPPHDETPVDNEDAADEEETGDGEDET